MKFDAIASSEIKSTHSPSRRISPNEVGFHRCRRFHPPARVDLVEKSTDKVDAFFLAGVERFELSTPGFGDQCSTSWAMPLYPSIITYFFVFCKGDGNNNYEFFVKTKRLLTDKRVIFCTTTAFFPYIFWIFSKSNSRRRSRTAWRFQVPSYRCSKGDPLLYLFVS